MIQNKLGKLERWSEISKMKFNKALYDIFRKKTSETQIAVKRKEGNKVYNALLSQTEEM